VTELKYQVSRLLRDSEERGVRRVAAVVAVAAASGEATMEQESETQKRVIQGP